MVSMRELRLTSRDNTIELACPWLAAPSPMLTNTAGSLWFVFNDMPGHMSHRNCCKLFNACAPHALDVLRLRPLDGCTANDKFLLKEIRDAEDCPSEFHVSIHCQQRSANLALTATTTTTGFEEQCLLSAVRLDEQG